MATKKDEQKFSIIDLFKGGIPNPAGYPIPRPPSSSSTKDGALSVAEKAAKYNVSTKTQKK